MDDDDRKEEAMEALDELSSALDEFDDQFEPYEMGEKLSIALNRLRVAVTRREDELGVFSGSDRESFLRDAKELEECTDMLAKEIAARDAGKK